MKKSFTLIEILVVIVIIGILSAFILVGMSSITKSANIAKSQAFINSMDNSMLLGRVSQWKLDESGTTTAAADSWLNNNGTLTNFVFTDANSGWRTGTQCVSNNCLSFDGTNDYITAPHLSSYAGPSITVAGWINVISGTEWILVDKYAGEVGGACGWYIYGAPTYARWVLWNNNTSTYQDFGITSMLNNWYYLVGTFDSTTGIQKVYTNGVLKNTDTGKSLGLTTVIALRIGGQAQSIWTRGLIDDVRVYNQAIPASEIEQNYFVGINNLYKNNGITLNEFNQRIVELKTNLVNE
jgi:prepilin-type N-terminal cleavage/methylation domain-containing protein